MRSLFVAAFTLLALPAAAFEPTGNAVADAFLRTLDGLEFGSATAGAVSRADGATVLEEVAGKGADKALTIARVRIEDGTVNADNALSAAAIDYDGLKIFDAAGKETGNVEAIALTDVRLAAATDETALTDLLGDFATVSMTGVTATSVDDETLTIEALNFVRTGRDTPDVSAITVVVDGLKFDLTLFGEPTESQIRNLGYEALKVYIKAAGAWSSADGRVVIEPSALSVAEMGTLKVEGAANGLTQAAFDALENANVEYPRLMELMGSVTVDGLTLSFLDNGLTDRLMDNLGKSAGADRATLVAQLTAALEAQVAAIGDAAFTRSVTGAVRQFLSEPGEMTVVAAPAQQISAFQIFSAAMLNPAVLPELLSLQISAD